MILEINDVACSICNAKDKKIIFSYDQPDQYEVAAGVTKEGYYRHWIQCTVCGFFYSIYSRDPDKLDNLYASAYRDNQSGWRKNSVEETFDKVAALPAEESETKFRVNWIKNHIKEAWDSGLVRKGLAPYRMLDIGGATGVFAYEFQDHEWRSHVIDPDENGNFVQTKLNIPFLQKSYEPNSFEFNFDLISLVFALEHMTEPVRLLQGLHQDMGPYSLLYIEVPDEVAFRLRPREDDIFNSCHIWMFGPHTLTTLLNSCGFEVLALNRTRTKRGHYSLMTLAGRK